MMRSSKYKVYNYVYNSPYIYDSQEFQVNINCRIFMVRFVVTRCTGYKESAKSSPSSCTAHHRRPERHTTSMC